MQYDKECIKQLEQINQLIKEINQDLRKVLQK